MLLGGKRRHRLRNVTPDRCWGTRNSIRASLIFDLANFGVTYDNTEIYFCILDLMFDRYLWRV